MTGLSTIAMVAAGLALTGDGAADSSPGQSPSPPLSVLFVETGEYRRWHGFYVTPDMPEDAIPWSGFIEMRVRVRDHVWGRSYPDNSNMVYVAHAPYVPGVRLLVIAEPRRDARGFFVRWYDQATYDGYCAPTEVIDALGVRTAFMTARHRRRDGMDLLCLQA